MGITIAQSAAAATTRTIAYGAGRITTAGTTIETQISMRDDFAFGIAPIYNSTTAASITHAGFNRATVYFARARNRFSDGTTDDWGNTITWYQPTGTPPTIVVPPVLIEPAMIVVPDPVISLTSAQTVAGFPERNLLIDAPIGWKAVAAGTVTLDVALSGKSFDTVALLASNLPEAATISITRANDAAFTSGVLNDVVSQPFRASPNLSGRAAGYHGLFRLTAQERAFLRIAIAGAWTANTLFIEHLVVGSNRATKNHSVDKTESAIMLGSIDRGRSGLPDRVSGRVMRKVEFEISMMTEAQYEQTYSDLMYLEGRPVLCLPNSKAGAYLHDRILYGDMKGGRVFNPSSPRYTRPFVIESLI